MLTSNQLLKAAKVLSSLLCLIALFGCEGGGTEGTGVPKSLFIGTLQTTAGDPFSEANLEIAETGATTQSDKQGKFSVESQRPYPNVTFIIRKGAFEATAVLSDAPVEDEKVSITISVDTGTNTAEARLIKLDDVKEFNIDAEIVGACRKKFKNTGKGLKQIGILSNGTSCTAMVEVRGDGELRGGVKVAVQRSSCQRNATWVTSEVRLTSTRAREGTVQLPFRFFTTERACRYRLIAPFGQESNSVAEIRISTLQELEKGN